VCNAYQGKRRSSLADGTLESRSLERIFEFAFILFNDRNSDSIRTLDSHTFDVVEVLDTVF